MSYEFGPVIRKGNFDDTCAEVEHYPSLTIGPTAVYLAELYGAVEHGRGSVVALRLAGDPVESQVPMPTDQPALFEMKEVA